jgi:hypothetical protein
MSNDKLMEIAAKYRAQAARSEAAPLSEDLYREKVLEARKMSAEEKFLAGERLFWLECEATLARIRIENPGVTEPECQQVLEESLRLGESFQLNP